MATKETEAQAVAAKPASPAKPAAPPKAAAAAQEAVTRREFNWLALAWTAFTAASVAGLTATMRFMFPNVLFEPPTVFKAGSPGTYKAGGVDGRYQER